MRNLFRHTKNVLQSCIWLFTNYNLCNTYCLLIVMECSPPSQSSSKSDNLCITTFSALRGILPAKNLSRLSVRRNHYKGMCTIALYLAPAYSFDCCRETTSTAASGFTCRLTRTVYRNSSVLLLNKSETNMFFSEKRRPNR